jgi:hypothetical protein
MKIYENLDLNNLKNEIWKDILDYEGDYQASNIGRIKSLKFSKERILKQYKDNHEYFSVELSKNGKGKPKQVHRLVYEAHIGKLEEGYDAHHINEDKEYNYIENLESKPHGKHTGDHNKGKILSEQTKNKISENHADYKGENNPLFGVYRPGEKSGNHKLKNGEVWLIKKILNSDYYKSKKITLEKIGKMFGVGISIISAIKHEKIWSHIKI